MSLDKLPDEPSRTLTNAEEVWQQLDSATRASAANVFAQMIYNFVAVCISTPSKETDNEASSDVKPPAGIKKYGEL